MKDDKSENNISLVNEYVQLMTKEIAEAMQEIFQTIEKRQGEIEVTINDLLKFFCNMIKDVNVVVNCSTPNIESWYELDPSKVQGPKEQRPVPLIKVHVEVESLDLGIQEFNDVNNSIDHVTIYFSHMQIIG